jgi:DNA-directed RNA polymerase subunit RPC12/RpoP
MSISFSCSSCQAKLRGKPESAGKKIKCPKCGQVVQLRPPAAPHLAGDARPVPKHSSQPARDIAVQLQQLHQLHGSGALSDEEFAQAKQAVLGDTPAESKTVNQGASEKPPDIVNRKSVVAEVVVSGHTWGGGAWFTVMFNDEFLGQYTLRTGCKLTIQTTPGDHTLKVACGTVGITVAKDTKVYAVPFPESGNYRITLQAKTGFLSMNPRFADASSILFLAPAGRQGVPATAPTAVSPVAVEVVRPAGGDGAKPGMAAKSPSAPSDIAYGPVAPKFAQLEAHERHLFTFTIKPFVYIGGWEAFWRMKWPGWYWDFSQSILHVTDKRLLVEPYKAGIMEGLAFKGMFALAKLHYAGEVQLVGSGAEEGLKKMQSNQQDWLAIFHTDIVAVDNPQLDYLQRRWPSGKRIT